MYSFIWHTRFSALHLAKVFLIVSIVHNGSGYRDGWGGQQEIKMDNGQR